ncbi:lipopolysaccharide transport system permease protein/teichoic acid transport system permease protein [Anoxybacillus tepidamans]|uniref:Transport permease protein n=1 Tax=Anoxybacteroides tepidamans TaxID=265948 RepID=A0A7W8IPE6_9BACL|nr:lipopolysaccharide transport system permease protein/teichoic acid transport system permease protein [Anoxybacillus tepidamans]
MSVNFLVNNFKVIREHRYILIQLIKKDLQNRYVGSFLGLFWAFFPPLVNIGVFWFIFEVGFKSVPVNNYPFILWLLTGMIPWFFISDSISYSSTSILDNKFLVKNVVFKLNILPFVRICSSLIIHLFFVLVLLLFFSFYGYKPKIYNLQVIYYILCTITLVYGISLITSSLIIFVKDLGQFLALILQIAFWITPIFWSLNLLPSKYHLLIKLNPFYYVVEGYRNSFIYNAWFWQYPRQTLFFWGVTFFTIGLGTYLYRKLRPHFADVI